MIKPGTQWLKSSYSNGNGGECVEVAVLDESAERPEHKPDATRVVRDSKNPDGAVLYFDDAEWEAFVAGVKDGEFS